jgi:hypothetical protein
MKVYAHKIGAVFYILWGLLHIAGGVVLLQQLAADGATKALATIGSAVPPVDLPIISGGVTAAVLAYYAWNILCIGLLVLVVGVKLNWNNSRMGYWLNLAVVGAVDLGLIFTLLAPGYMALADGGLGLALWLPAAIFSTIGLLHHHPQRAGQGVPA